LNTGEYVLSGGLPNGGTYSGVGVSGGNFNSNIVVAGLHNTLYTYTDENTCTKSDSSQIYVDVCTGIYSVSDLHSLNIYPNPNNGQFEIVVTTPSKVEIYNVLGKLITTKNINTKEKINLTDQGSGIYLVKITSKNTITTQKVIVNE
jgi:hypothetical protein